jgi:nicotinamidase/pyrazinamidase
MSKLLLVIDTQVDFVMADGKLPVPDAERIIAPGIRYLAALDPVVYRHALFTFDTHDAVAFIGSPENIGDEPAGVPGFPIHCEKGTPGWENVFNLSVVPSAINPMTLEKGVFDMWAENDLPVTTVHDGALPVDRDTWFRQLASLGVDTVTVFGVASDFCVMWAVRGLLDRGFRVEVVEHLTAGIQRDMAQTAADEFPGRLILV